VNGNCLWLIRLLTVRSLPINLRFRNISSSIANLLSVSFYDSTRSVLEEALTLTALAEEEAVELEYFLYDRPAFVWLHTSNSSISIPPAAEEEISIQALGKRGLVHGTVCVEYSSFEIVPAHVGNYSRRIEVPLAITVNAALELVSCDFTTFKPESSAHIQKVEDLDTRFIIVLEFKNSWINALQLAITATEPGHSQRKFLETVQSGQTRRCAIDLPRVLIAPQDAETRLPRRNKVQQFVVSSSPSEVAHRRAWWYRERILNSLSAAWSEHLSDGRRGEVDLRGIQLSDRHIPIVAKEGVGVEVRVTQVEQTLPVQIVFQLIVVINSFQGLMIKT
jgi:Transport protein Trs120 or TRAPPC9, TRAPP II complex subunit